MKSLNSQFWWVSHTWDHANLDCYTQSNNGTCVPATLAESHSELNQNISVAPKLGIMLDTTSMVTPYNSGFTNPNFLQAAAQVEFGTLSIRKIPPVPIPDRECVSPVHFRDHAHNNDLFDDVSSPQTGVYGSWPDEYNAKYGPQGNPPLYAKDQNYSEIFGNESDTSSPRPTCSPTNRIPSPFISTIHQPMTVRIRCTQIFWTKRSRNTRSSLVCRLSLST